MNTNKTFKDMIKESRKVRNETSFEDSKEGVRDLLTKHGSDELKPNNESKFTSKYGGDGVWLAAFPDRETAYVVDVKTEEYEAIDYSSALLYFPELKEAVFQRLKEDGSPYNINDEDFVDWDYVKSEMGAVEDFAVDSIEDEDFAEAPWIMALNDAENIPLEAYNDVVSAFKNKFDDGSVDDDGDEVNLVLDSEEKVLWAFTLWKRVKGDVVKDDDDSSSDEDMDVDDTDIDLDADINTGYPGECIKRKTSTKEARIIDTELKKVVYVTVQCKDAGEFKSVKNALSMIFSGSTHREDLNTIVVTVPAGNHSDGWNRVHDVLDGAGIIIDESKIRAESVEIHGRMAGFRVVIAYDDEDKEAMARWLETMNGMGYKIEQTFTDQIVVVIMASDAKEAEDTVRDLMNKIEPSLVLESVRVEAASLKEGQFSWFTQDTNQQIGSAENNKIDVWMFDNTGQAWHEPDYEGYGRFGGKDFYELTAEMNGYEGDDAEGKRDAGIDLYFGDEETIEEYGKTRFPALVTDEKYKWEEHDFTDKPKNDPDQGWGNEDEEDDDLDWGDEDVYHGGGGDHEIHDDDDGRPTVRLSGTDGNAFVVLGKVTAALKKAGFTSDDISKYRDEATSGDYDHLLQVTMNWVNVESKQRKVKEDIDTERMSIEEFWEYYGHPHDSDFEEWMKAGKSDYLKPIADFIEIELAADDWEDAYGGYLTQSESKKRKTEEDA